jgi:RimJ/RimL family protein N-acetyltransferase
MVTRNEDTLLSGRNVALLSMEYEDVIQTLASDAAVAATTKLPHPYPTHAARDFIIWQIREREAGRSHVVVIRNRETVVGLCGLHNIVEGYSGELGFWIGRPYWNQGYATFGADAVLRFAFLSIRLQSVYAKVLETNRSSRRVLEKLGLSFAWTEKHEEPKWDPQERLVVYDIAHSQWLGRSTASASASVALGSRVRTS